MAEDETEIPKAHATRSKTLQALQGPGLVGVFVRGATGALGIRALSQLAALGALSVLTHVMSVEAFGVYAYVYAIVATALIPCVMGLDWGLVRFTGGYVAGRQWALLRGLLRRSDQLVVGTGILLGLGMIGVGGLLQARISPALYEALWWGACLLPVWALVTLRQYLLRALKHVVLADVPPLVGQSVVLAAVAGGMYVGLGRPLQAAEAMQSLGVGLGAALLLGSYGRWRLLPSAVGQTPPRYATRLWLRTSLPMFLVAGFRQIITRTDVLLIGALAGPVEAGLYVIASRLAGLVAFGLSGVASISGPMMAEYHSRGAQKQLQKLAALAAWGCTLSALVLALVLVLGRGLLLGWFGAAYVQGGTVLVILTIGQVINAGVGPVGILLNMTDLQDANARATVWTAVLNVALNVPAVWYYGMEGAAVVTALTVGLKNLWAWYLAWKHLGINASIFTKPVRVGPAPAADGPA